MKEQAGCYEATVSVSTRRVNGKVSITFNDKGNRKSLKALDRIFQPFFRTKPAGQGTGLGLSMSDDIIKVHG
jgi:two-component system NtrC family sensor kinase